MRGKSGVAHVPRFEKNKKTPGRRSANDERTYSLKEAYKQPSPLTVDLPILTYKPLYCGSQAEQGACGFCGELYEYLSR